MIGSCISAAMMISDKCSSCSRLRINPTRSRPNTHCARAPQDLPTAACLARVRHPHAGIPIARWVRLAPQVPQPIMPVKDVAALVHCATGRPRPLVCGVRLVPIHAGGVAAAPVVREERLPWRIAFGLWTVDGVGDGVALRVVRNLIIWRTGIE